jgi:serine phosphatase RsbU (regulator of sigma subunit)
MEGALLLGIVEGAEFSVMRFQLAPGDVLMLISDGIVEAQDEQANSSALSAFKPCCKNLSRLRT